MWVQGLYVESIHEDGFEKSQISKNDAWGFRNCLPVASFSFVFRGETTDEVLKG